jgi:pimeloyl-ACP methyl ester carboxylesterase
MSSHLIIREPKVRTKPHSVVFVHGAWHGAWCWDEYFLAYFTDKGYVALAPDLQNHGTSRGHKALRWLRIDDYVADLAAVVAALATPPILVGHSMGGLVVQKYLERATVQAAILLAPVPVHGALGATLRTAQRIPYQFLKANAQMRLYPLIETEELAREAFFSATINTSLLKRYFDQLQDESYMAFLDMVVLRLPRPKRIHAPILGSGLI